MTTMLAVALAGPLQAAEKERICWLSDLDLTKVEQNWGFAIIKDKNYTNKPLSIADKQYERGFQTVFSVDQSTFELELKPGVLRFLASVGVNDEHDFRGPVEFLVYGDAELLWSSGHMQAGDAAKAVDVPLAGRKRLLLLVTHCGDPGFRNGDWADSRILLDGGTAGELVSVAPHEPAEILTPRPGPEPKITGARVFGVRPGNPFFFKIPATGAAPITFAAKGLPDGLKVDPMTGVSRQKDLGVIDGEFSATLPRHGVMLLRIAAAKM